MSTEHQVRVSTSTPRISARDAALFRILVEPADRRRHGLIMATIGDVLDTRAADRCQVRQRWFSPDREEGGIVAKACGQRTCPVCVVGWLAQRAGRAWAFWKGYSLRVDVRIETAGAWKWARESNGWKVQGEAAAPGILDLPMGDDLRRVFVPEQLYEGPTASALYGAGLDEELVRGIRAIRIPPTMPRDREAPSPTFGLIPRWLSMERAVMLAKTVGLEVTVAGHENVRYRGTLAQTEAWITLMRQAA
jgi:hypothetical protein